MAWKTVFTTFSVVEATIMAARLEDEGIPTYTRQEAAGMAYGLSSGLMGQIDVLVPDSVAEQALAIVDDLGGKTMASTDIFNSKYFRLYELADGVYAAISRDREGGAGGNAGFVDLGDKVLVFDAFLLPQAARLMLDAVDKLIGKPVRILVNSHNHSDHTYGNGIFPKDALIVASTATRATLITEGAEEIEADKEELPRLLGQLGKELDEAGEANDIARQAIIPRINLYTALLESIDEISVRPPDATFEGRLTFHGLGRSVELITYGAGHTDGDVFLYLPDDRIIFTGDLLFAKSHPYILDSTPESWRTGLDKMLALDFETVVPGHGEIGGAEDLRAERDYLKAVEELVRKVIADGGTVNDAARLVIPPEYATWEAPRRFPESMQFLFERLSERK